MLGKNEGLKRRLILILFLLGFFNVFAKWGDECGYYRESLTKEELIPYRSGVKWGFKDTLGNKVVKAKYSSVKPFSIEVPNFTFVQKRKKQILIDKFGRVLFETDTTQKICHQIIDANYVFLTNKKEHQSYVLNFRDLKSYKTDSIFKIKQNSLLLFRDTSNILKLLSLKTGKVLRGESYYTDFRYSLTGFRKDYLVTYIDTIVNGCTTKAFWLYNGDSHELHLSQIVGDNIYKSINSNYLSIYKSCSDGNQFNQKRNYAHSLIDGNLIGGLFGEYIRSSPVRKDRYKVKKQDKIGLYDLEGKEVIPPVYLDIKCHPSRYVCKKNESEFDVLDSNEVRLFSFNGMGILYNYRRQVFFVYESKSKYPYEGRFGIYNNNGKQITSMKYLDGYVDDYKNEITVLFDSTNGYWIGKIDLEGNRISKFIKTTYDRYEDSVENPDYGMERTNPYPDVKAQAIPYWCSVIKESYLISINGKDSVVYGQGLREPDGYQERGKIIIEPKPYQKIEEQLLQGYFLVENRNKGIVLFTSIDTLPIKQIVPEKYDTIINNCDLSLYKANRRGWTDVYTYKGDLLFSVKGKVEYRVYEGRLGFMIYNKRGKLLGYVDWNGQKYF